MSDDQESQSDEISVLQSIYNDEEFSVNKKETYSGQFHAYVSIPEKLLLLYKNLMNYEDELESIQVEHLPPICLYFDLPLTYPSSSPPQYKLSCPWLTVKLIVYLCMRLDELWEENEGTPILYTWMDFLKNESLAYLEISNVLDIRGIFTQDLRLRGRRACTEGRRAESDSQREFWEERKRCWNERKNYKSRRPPIKKQTRPGKKNNNNKASGNSETITPISALDNTQDCVRSSSNIINLNETGVVQRLDNVKNESCVDLPSSQQASPVPHEKKEDFILTVKNKFGIDINRPQYLDKITISMTSKHRDRIERKRNSTNIIALLVSFNEDRTLSEFKKGFYSCDICFQSQVGAKCTQFKPCNHIYCAECIRSYFAVRVNENTVQSMPCPHDKCGSEASQNQIKEVLGEELYARYDRLLLNATLDMMSDVVYCPRKGCQLPVLVESDRMAYCHTCTFAFCVLCLRTYHGVQPCAMKNEEKRKLAMKYNDATGSERALLEARYGKQQLVSLLQNVLSTDWISENSKDCPSCRTSIEKSDGCNKMVCTKCNTIFCWLCHTVLDRDAPYKHFYDLKSKCYNQLFLGITISDDEDDEDFENDDDIFVIYGQDDDEFDDYFFELPEEEGYDF